MIGFISNETSWGALWVPMAMLNVWRIPLLFFVSGMGVYYAIQNRNWSQLLLERARRILLPFVFGMFFIVPLHVFIWQNHYHWKPSYVVSPAHLWFLGNIFVYVVVLSPVFFYFKKNKQWLDWLRKLFATPLGLLPVLAAFVAEAMLVDPNQYEQYALTWHGFILGMLAFFFGFCFSLSDERFWKMIMKWRWVFLSAAILLYGYRVGQVHMRVPSFQLAFESVVWVLSVFAFSNKYLNRPSKVLEYLSQAAYPVYILHMVFLFLLATAIFGRDIDIMVQFFLVLLFTLIGCLVTYEFLIRRVNFIRPLFGLKSKRLVGESQLSDIK